VRVSAVTGRWRVVATSGLRCQLLADGERVVAVQRRNQPAVLCGDWVALEDATAVNGSDARNLVVASIETRTSTFFRADRSGKPQAIAANLDQLWLVIAPLPLPTRDLIHRYRVAAGVLGIAFGVVVNKSELRAIPELHSDEWQEQLDILQLLESQGVPLVKTSTRTEQGVETLRAAIGAQAAILVGMSGAGKSSLSNALQGIAASAVGELSKAHGKGKHTTTTTEWHCLPGGGALIDSPGVWEYGLWQIAKEQIWHGFPDFAALSQHCKFANCLHVNEPNCAVRSAVDKGEVTESRYLAYLRVLKALPVGDYQR
jgi:ribosome biogenesis GTPase / thiamine phosphate phosphatase